MIILQGSCGSNSRSLFLEFFDDGLDSFQLTCFNTVHVGSAKNKNKQVDFKNGRQQCRTYIPYSTDSELDVDSD